MTEKNNQAVKQQSPNLWDFIHPDGRHYAFFCKRLEELAQNRINPIQLLAVALREYNAPIERDKQSIKSCSVDTVLNSLCKIAQWGLNLGENDHVYLIPYNGVCKAELGYRGKIELASRAGIRMTARIIYSNDKFTCAYGNKKFLKHELAWPDRGVLQGAYSYATFPDGDFDFFMRTGQEMYDKNRASAKTKIVWDKYFEEMCLKTIINMHYKYLPSTLGGTQHLLPSDTSEGILIDQEIQKRIEQNSESPMPIINNLKPDTADILIEKLMES